jgi:hypothetical protein
MGGSAGMGGSGGMGGAEACDSTAGAFIKVIDGMGNLTDSASTPTTDSTNEWARGTVELLIDAAWEGQTLQFGFATTASNNEPSGVFYDNVEVNPDMQYTSNFEDPPYALNDPDALGDDPSTTWGDGWVIYANVFEPDGTTFLYGYNIPLDPAPNGQIEGYSALVAGEGGPDQGAQQLSIFSDYNNQADQTQGNRIESNVFRERTLTAADAGATITFGFDYKRGNINAGCP